MVSQNESNSAQPSVLALSLYKLAALAFAALIALFAVAGCSCSSSANSGGSASQENNTSSASNSSDASSQGSQGQGNSNDSSSSSSSTSSEASSSSSDSSSGFQQSGSAVATGKSNGYSKVTSGTKPSTVSDSLWQTLTEYEQTMFDYYDFLKQYNANPSDSQLVSQAESWAAKVKPISEKFTAIDESTLSQEEQNYYKEVQNRVSLMMEQLGNE